ncbi:MAG: Gfo/Idh/MocA family oxidoreductase [Clostridia bacterium]|nr:Gfo/Idh/MocA family oxidoreductase [Clostridia bacterium]
MLKVAILGYGGIARSHRKGYELLAAKGAPVDLVALCDIDPEQFTKLVTINQGGSDQGAKKEYRTYTDLEEMLAKEELDVIDICLPTYLHCEYAVKLLKRGYHVQSEKPMGLNPAQCAEMLKAAEESGKKLMVGMCLRFDCYYEYLKDLVDSEKYGKVTSAVFERLSGLPRWGYQGWFRDYNRSGGVALDMHIHDVDMIRYLFGEPKAVSALALDGEVKCTTIHSRFCYDDKIIFAVGDWGQSSSCKFSAGYRVNFEKATVILRDGVLTVCPEEGEPFIASEQESFVKTHHMAEEIEFFAHTILGDRENDRNQPSDAAGSVALVAKLMESAENNGAYVTL